MAIYSWSYGSKSPGSMQVLKAFREAAGEEVRDPTTLFVR